MAETKITDLDAAVSVDRSTNYLEIAQSGSSNKITPNQILGITGDPIGTSDSQTLTNKTLTSPTISGPTLSGTVAGTYTIGGTPTFPSSVVTLTGTQTLTNKTLTSPTINTATISNPTITADAISEHTAANGITIDGLNIKDSKLNTNNSVVTANITDGAVTPPKWTNPYKFSAYRAAAQTPAGGVIQYDTENFDSNNNFDITTNKGRYTVPVSGYYQFNVNSVQIVGSAPQDPLITLRKNGTTIIADQHFVNMYNGTSEGSLTISTLVQLTAGDYVEVLGGNLALKVSQVGSNSFSGFLVSQT